MNQMKKNRIYIKKKPIYHPPAYKQQEYKPAEYKAPSYGGQEQSYPSSSEYGAKAAASNKVEQAVKPDAEVAKQ